MRRFLLLAAVLLCLQTFASAQIISGYVTYSPYHLTGVENGVNSSFQPQFTDYWASGIGGGVTVGLLPLHIVFLGFDLRGSTAPGASGADTALAGLKLGIHPPLIHIKPYVQASGGYLATRAINVTNATVSGAGSGNTITQQYAVWEVLGGIDYPILPFLDIRAIEVGGGKAVCCGGSPYPSLFTVNTGLVVHF